MAADYPRDEPGDEPLDWPNYVRPDPVHLIGTVLLSAVLLGVLLFFALYG